jgi:low affinity Fe/Cu permease
MKKALLAINTYMEGMAGPVTRLFIYISIACLTSLMKDFSQYQTFDQISAVTWILIIINFFLQGLVAWRAYIDGSYQDAVKKLEEGKKLAAQQEKLLNG